MNISVFGLIDVFIAIFFLIVLVIYCFINWNINKEKAYFKYYLPNFFFKLLMALLFVLTSVYVIGGGDTFAYYEGALKLNNLFWENPSGYFNELFSTPSQFSIGNNFSNSTGYPPGWIYKEPESFFICKLLSIPNFFCLNSYLALTIFCSFLVSVASWKLYEMIKDFTISTNTWKVFACFFIPTVTFWCSGISKDTIVLSSFFFLLYHIFSILDEKRKFRINNLFYIILYVFILYHTRSFMLTAIGGPILLSFGIGFLKKISKNKGLIFFVRFFIIIGTIISIIIAASQVESILPEEYLNEMAVVQQDFKNNQTYTGPRYSLGIEDYSPTGMLLSAPSAIIAAFFRPFLWEASSAFLLLSALEGTLLFYLLFRFVFSNGGILIRIQSIRKNEFLIFCFVFVLILGFFVGFSSVLLNVLIRFKAPILPLLVLLLSSGIVVNTNPNSKNS